MGSKKPMNDVISKMQDWRLDFVDLTKIPIPIVEVMKGIQCTDFSEMVPLEQMWKNKSDSIEDSSSSRQYVWEYDCFCLNHFGFRLIDFLTFDPLRFCWGKSTVVFFSINTRGFISTMSRETATTHQLVFSFVRRKKRLIKVGLSRFGKCQQPDSSQRTPKNKQVSLKSPYPCLYEVLAHRHRKYLCIELT
jgi:hypothetical protein